MISVGEALRKTRTFFDEVRMEMKKSTWPARAELLESTFVVIVSVILVSLYVGVSDKVLVTLVGLMVR